MLPMSDSLKKERKDNSNHPAANRGSSSSSVFSNNLKPRTFLNDYKDACHEFEF